MRRIYFSTLNELVYDELIPMMNAGLGTEYFEQGVFQEVAWNIAHNCTKWDDEYKMYELDWDKVPNLTELAEECAKKTLGV